MKGKVFIDFDKIAEIKPLTISQKRKGYAKLNELRSELAKDRFLMRKLKSEKKDLAQAEIYLLNKKIQENKSEFLAVKNVVKGKTSFEFGNKTITLKNSTIKKSKNPTERIFNLYKRSTETQIKNLKKNGEEYKEKYLKKQLKNTKDALFGESEKKKKSEEFEDIFDEDIEDMFEPKKIKKSETPNFIFIQEKRGIIKISNLK